MLLKFCVGYYYRNDKNETAAGKSFTVAAPDIGIAYEAGCKYIAEHHNGAEFEITGIIRTNSRG